ncbi:MAG TPA: cytochrome c [Opitutaceae bacterium]|jgi:mono/diheme cytochrome c family protein
MSVPPSDPRFDRAAASDDALLNAHEAAVGPQSNDRAHYPLRPLILLFVTSGFILFAATYLNRYAGQYDPTVFNENAAPSRGSEQAVKIDPVAMGKRLFNSGGACFTCHQPTGMGIPGVYPPLAGSEWAQGSPDRVIRILLAGLGGPITVEGKTFSTAQMPSFGASGFNWSDDKISQVLTYVRQEWGNKAGPITAEQVAAVRAVAGDHKTWTADELLQVK